MSYRRFLSSAWKTGNGLIFILQYDSNHRREVITSYDNFTKRTLARYRQKKLVTYYMIDGRTYYKASEVQDFLSRKGKVLPAKIKKELGIQF